MPSSPPSQGSRSRCQVSDISNERNFVQFLHVVQSDDTRRGNKENDLRHDARQQGMSRVTTSQRHKLFVVKRQGHKTIPNNLSYAKNRADVVLGSSEDQNPLLDGFFGEDGSTLETGNPRHEKPSPEAVPLRGVNEKFDLLVLALLRLHATRHLVCHSAHKSCRTCRQSPRGHDHSVILFTQSPRKTF